MPLPRIFLTLVLGAVACACTRDPFAGLPKPANFCNYPVSGNLRSVSVADLEAVAAKVKPDKIYGVDILGHDEIQVRITPTRRGSDSWVSFKRTRESWQRTEERILRIAATQISSTGR